MEAIGGPVRATSANSNYEFLQLDLKSRFGTTPLGQVQLEAGYIYAHCQNDASDGTRYVRISHPDCQN